MPRDLAAENERRQAMDASFRAASERTKDSPDVMRETARGLRQRASQMPNTCDRDAMLRLAAGYELRATLREQHS